MLMFVTLCYGNGYEHDVVNFFWDEKQKKWQVASGGVKNVPSRLFSDHFLVNLVSSSRLCCFQLCTSSVIPTKLLPHRDQLGSCGVKESGDMTCQGLCDIPSKLATAFGSSSPSLFTYQRFFFQYLWNSSDTLTDSSDTSRWKANRAETFWHPRWWKDRNTRERYGKKTRDDEKAF